MNDKTKSIIIEITIISIIIICIVIVIMTFSSDNVEATDVGGHITSDTTWNLTGSPYIIKDNITVNAGITLTIEPGVIVKYFPEMSMFVYGNLHANGDEAGLIKFTAFDPTSRTPEYCIKIEEGGWADIEYCEISYFSYGIKMESVSNIMISNSEFKNINVKGINLRSGSNITIINCSFYDDIHYGIDLINCNKVTIHNISFYDFIYQEIGIWGDQKSHYDHVMTNCTSDGKSILYFFDINNQELRNIAAGQIIVAWSDNILIDQCNMASGKGITCYYITNSTFTNCNFSFNPYGLKFYESVGNLVYGNSFYSNNVGLYMYDHSDENIIRMCNFTSNDYGIRMSYICTSNNISLCTFSFNNYGLYLSSSNNNNIFYNDIYANQNGIYLDYCESNTVYHNNIIDNEEQAYAFNFGGMNNIWSLFEEGNYWSDYSQEDIDGDNIGDEPYIIGYFDTDHFPLILPYSGSIPPDMKPPLFTQNPQIYDRVISFPREELFISFSINEKGTYEVIIDSDGVEGFDNSSDIVIKGDTSGGSVNVNWDGTDYTGNFIDDGTYKVQVMIWDTAGNSISEPRDAGLIDIKIDTDSDGIRDVDDAFPDDPNEDSDLDGDGIGDNSDNDLDGDGVDNNKDKFPWNRKEWNDSDSDGIGDNSDPDANGNNIADVLEIPLVILIIMIPILMLYFTNKYIKKKKESEDEEEKSD
jgi:parallel beta-helix repeat protein